MLHVETSAPATTFEESNPTSLSPSPRQDFDPDREVVEQYSTRRIHDGIQERDTSPSFEAETVEDQRPDPRPRVPYLKDQGYGTLAHVDPALATVGRPLRYLDLRPTTPEAGEVTDTLEQWRTRILEAPFPVDKMALMDQFREEGKDLGYPAFLAAEQMIEMRLAVEAKQTALRLAAREKSGAKIDDRPNQEGEADLHAVAQETCFEDEDDERPTEPTLKRGWQSS